LSGGLHRSSRDPLSLEGNAASGLVPEQPSGTLWPAIPTWQLQGCSIAGCSSARLVQYRDINVTRYIRRHTAFCITKSNGFGHSSQQNRLGVRKAGRGTWGLGGFPELCPVKTAGDSRFFSAEIFQEQELSPRGERRIGRWCWTKAPGEGNQEDGRRPRHEGTNPKSLIGERDDSLGMKAAGEPRMRCALIQTGNRPQA
jgi:hypothetical protein